MLVAGEDQVAGAELLDGLGAVTELTGFVNLRQCFASFFPNPPARIFQERFNRRSGFPGSQFAQGDNRMSGNVAIAE